MMFSHTVRVEENISPTSSRLPGGNLAAKPSSTTGRRVLGDITNHHPSGQGGLGGKQGKNNQQTQPDKAPVKVQPVIKPAIKPIRAPSLRPVEYVTSHIDDAEGRPYDATSDIMDRVRTISSRMNSKTTPTPETPLELDLAEFDAQPTTSHSILAELDMDGLDLDDILDI